MTKLLSVSGYGWSGSGLLVDLFKNQPENRVLGNEFPLISEPDGLIDLAGHFGENWHFIKTGVAINRFNTFAKQSIASKSLFNPGGLGLNEVLEIDADNRLKDFIDEITHFEYKSRTRVNFTFGNDLDKAFRKLMWKLVGSNTATHIFSHLDFEEFANNSRNFLNSLLWHDELNTVLDQAIPASNFRVASRIMPECTQYYVVDRDPRDVFAELMQTGGLIGAELKQAGIKETYKFIHWYKTIREKSDFKGIATYVRFENLVLGNGDDRDRLNNTYGKNLFKDYSMNRSKRNVGKWQNVDRVLIETIMQNIDYPYL